MGDVTFLQKSYHEHTKVEKLVVVTMSYEGQDEEEELQIANVVNDSESDSSNNDIKNNNDNFFDEVINNQVKATPQTTINTKVVTAIKKCQASSNDDANKIVEQATQEKSAIEHLNFLINLAMVTNDTKPVPEEPKTFNKAWDHPNANS